MVTFINMLTQYHFQGWVSNCNPQDIMIFNYVPMPVMISYRTVPYFCMQWGCCWMSVLRSVLHVFWSAFNWNLFWWTCLLIGLFDPCALWRHCPLPCGFIDKMSRLHIFVWWSPKWDYVNVVNDYWFTLVDISQNVDTESRLIRRSMFPEQNEWRNVIWDVIRPRRYYNICVFSSSEAEGRNIALLPDTRVIAMIGDKSAQARELNTIGFNQLRLSRRWIQQNLSVYKAPMLLFWWWETMLTSVS